MKLPIIYETINTPLKSMKSQSIFDFQSDGNTSFIQYFSKLPKCFGIVAKNLANQIQFNTGYDRSSPP